MAEKGRERLTVKKDATCGAEEGEGNRSRDARAARAVRSKKEQPAI